MTGAEAIAKLLDLPHTLPLQGAFNTGIRDIVLETASDGTQWLRIVWDD